MREMNRATLYIMVSELLYTSLKISPPQSNKLPIIRKSKADQFTSVVNCIAKSGIIKTTAVVAIISLIERLLESMVNHLSVTMF